MDAYVADLQRLLTLSGHQSSDDDPIVVEKFIAGLPTDFARQLRLRMAGRTAGDQQLHGVCSCAASDEPGRPCVGRDRRDRRGGSERAVDEEKVGVPVLPLPRSGAHAKKLPKEEF